MGAGRESYSLYETHASGTAGANGTWQIAGTQAQSNAQEDNNLGQNPTEVSSDIAERTQDVLKEASASNGAPIVQSKPSKDRVRVHLSSQDKANMVNLEILCIRKVRSGFAKVICSQTLQRLPEETESAEDDERGQTSSQTCDPFFGTVKAQDSGCG